MAIRIVDENEPYRLISDDNGRWAVIEARAGHVYSLHARHRRAAEDNGTGMAVVVGGDGWRDEQTARQRYAAMCSGEDGYSKIIW